MKTIIAAIIICGLVAYIIPTVAEIGKDLFEILAQKDLGLEEYEEDIDE